MPGTPSPTSVSTKMQRIAELARRAPSTALTTLAHHIDAEFLREAYRRTRKDGAPGVDRQTAEEYAQNLEANLQALLDRFKSGTYRAPPEKRVHIPKADGTKTRPIGIPTFEDKVLQRAVAMVLETVYEQEFLDCSYGFRPGRSAHQALQRLWEALTEMGGARLHALLGQVVPRIHGAEAPDRAVPLSAGAGSGDALVPQESAPVGRESATQPQPAAAGALRVLRHHR